MKIVILYREESEHARAVYDFTRDFEHRTHRDVELISLETHEGADMARNYGITNYPGVLAVDNSGNLHKDWQGEPMPLIDEVAYYSNMGI